MNTLAGHLGSNYWCVLVAFLPRIALRIFNLTSAASRGMEYRFLNLYANTSLLLFILSHCLIFRSEDHRLMANPPLKDNWKTWFFLLYAPHAICCLLFGILAGFKVSFFWLLFPALMYPCLICTWLRLSAAGQGAGKTGPEL